MLRRAGAPITATAAAFWTGARPARFLPASPALVVVYLSALAAAGQAPLSLDRAHAAIAHAHARVGRLPPHRTDGGLVIREALAGIRRTHTILPDRKAPADADFLLAPLGSITGDGLAAVRDRVLLNLGMALATWRSGLVGAKAARQPSNAVSSSHLVSKAAAHLQRLTCPSSPRTVDPTGF